MSKVELPHSWDMDSWPVQVWPGSADRARQVVRAHRQDLEKFGALARPGKNLVFFGVAYERWLASTRSRVSNFEIAPNRS